MGAKSQGVSKSGVHPPKVSKRGLCQAKVSAGPKWLTEGRWQWALMYPGRFRHWLDPENQKDADQCLDHGSFQHFGYSVQS
jgi:hypothetical protein